MDESNDFLYQEVIKSPPERFVWALLLVILLSMSFILYCCQHLPAAACGKKLRHTQSNQN